MNPLPGDGDDQSPGDANLPMSGQIEKKKIFKKGFDILCIYIYINIKSIYVCIISIYIYTITCVYNYAYRDDIVCLYVCTLVKPVYVYIYIYHYIYIDAYIYK